MRVWSHLHPRLLVRSLRVIRPVDALSWGSNPHRRPYSGGRYVRSDLTSVNGIERGPLVCRARDRAGQRFARIGEDQRMVTGATERHIELLTIDQLAASSGVDVDQNQIDGCTLAGAGSDRVVVKLRSARMPRNGGIEAEPKTGPREVDFSYAPENFLKSSTESESGR